MSNNPFESPVDFTIKHSKSSSLRSALSMLLLPAMVGIATTFVCQYLDKTLGWDERAVSYFLGIPSAIFAIGLAVYLWHKGHPAIATVGAVFWVAVGIFAIWATFAF